MQVDTRERGFSYAYDAPLDMRMDPEQELTAAEIVNTWDRRRLARTLREYGEERFADRIAGEIVRRRGRPLNTTFELVDAITAAIPAPARFAGGHPAKRTFQAIRIAVNERARPARRGAPAGVGRARRRRPPRRDLLPLARGPARQALPRRPGARLHLPARPARLRRAAARRRPSSCSAARSCPRRARSRPTRARSRLACGPPASSGRSARCRPRTRAPAAPARRPAARRVSGPSRPAPAAAPAGPLAARRPAPSSAPRACRTTGRRPAAAQPRVDLADRHPARRDRRHAGLAAQAQRRHLARGRRRRHARAPERRPRGRDRPPVVRRPRPRRPRRRRAWSCPPAGAVAFLRSRPERDARRAAGRMQPPSEEAAAIMANGGLEPGVLAAPRGAGRPGGRSGRPGGGDHGGPGRPERPPRPRPRGSGVRLIERRIGLLFAVFLALLARRREPRRLARRRQGRDAQARRRDPAGGRHHRPRAARHDHRPRRHRARRLRSRR